MSQLSRWVNYPKNTKKQHVNFKNGIEISTMWTVKNSTVEASATSENYLSRWNYFKIISATLNMLEKIDELQ